MEIMRKILILEIALLRSVSELPVKYLLENMSRKSHFLYLWYQFITLTPSASLSDR
jgi:hypothetical protein